MFRDPESDKKQTKWCNSETIQNFLILTHLRVLLGQTVYAKLHWRYFSEMSWLQYQNNKVWNEQWREHDFVGDFLWFLPVLLVWPPQSWLSRVTFLDSWSFLKYC